ncbi:MAG: hypothetical protein JXA82_12485 [Sedimentisphaerales bacterium]|nr:hypothetical protein [Sedimentisphaerales bacterium]
MTVHARTVLFCMIIVGGVGGACVALTAYTPQAVADHTHFLLTNPYTTPTASGDQNGVIGHSRGWSSPLIPSHDLYGYRITDPESSYEKTTIVMISGNHNGEHSGNWALQGMVDFLAGDDPYAAQLRQHADVFVYPLVNPDGRFLGSGRGNPELTSAGLGNDHNRVWNRTGVSTIDAFTAAMKYDTGGIVDYFFDFHSTFFQASNFVTLTPELGDSRFVQELRAIAPEVGVVYSDGTCGMARIWSMSTNGLNADYAYTMEQHMIGEPADYLALGRTYGIALYNTLIPEPATFLLFLLGLPLIFYQRHKSVGLRPQSNHCEENTARSFRFTLQSPVRSACGGVVQLPSEINSS